MALPEQRLNGTPDEGVFIGIITTLKGRDFGRMVPCDFNIDVSHGDGFGGVTKTQRETYIQILKAALDRLEKTGPVSQGNQIAIQRVGQG